MSRRKIVLLTMAIPVFAVAWWMGSPLFLDRTVDESFPLAAGAATTAEPEALKRGEFRDMDNLHRGTGSASLYRLDDGSHVLRFEDFEVTNGPDLYVLVSPAADIRTVQDLDRAGYVELAELKGNIGDQNYSIPAEVDVAGQGTVIIYCKAFHVLFSVAELSDVA